jgi:hypothetical protein
MPEPRPVAHPSAAPRRRPVPEVAAFPDTARPAPWLAEPEPEPAAWAADPAPEWLPAAAGVADQTAPPPETVRVAVNLARTGITATVDRFVATEPGTPRWTPVVIARDEPLEVRHLGDRRRGVRTAILVGAAAVALVVALVLVAVLVRRGGG